jgi:acyl transferase domain-containing protein/thioesterase domain-containing protein/acyl carrier protein
MTGLQDSDIEQIAVIGMACRFPEAGNIDQFWQNLREGKESVTLFSEEELLERGVPREEFSHPDYVRSGVVLENIDLFDAEFFGYTARQAEVMDPQQRIFLEVAWEALENAGCNPDTYEGSIGVFGGTGGNDYRKRISADLSSVGSNIESFQSMISNDPDYLTTRVAYNLNLKGPCYTLQTACSTSLVAIHVACQNLLMYQCDMALAGGVSIRLPQGLGYRYHEGMIWSRDGHCRAFDADSRGIMLGRGAGIVVLKRLSEALAERDHIYAVLKASAVNNDGAIKVGFTAPSVDGQASVITLAQELCDVSPDTISCIEAHGTGTPLGDPIEVEALTKVFRARPTAKNYCAIGSVKTNIGHLDAAAGVASLIKTALALENRQIPPSLHYKRPNPNIDFENSPFYVNTELRDWKSDTGPRRAGVSSFGIGGTNAHVVMEEAPACSIPGPSRPWQLLLLSARYEKGVGIAATKLAAYLRDNPDSHLADVAYTLQIGRKHFDYRLPFVCKDIEHAVELLSTYITPVHSVAAERKEDIVFMFSGQGSQYIAMGEGIYHTEPVFKEHIDYCTEILQPLLDIDLRDVLFPSPEKVTTAKELINQTRITQPALFVIEYSLAKLLGSWGITPNAMVGHSIGEYVAACLAGVFTLDGALSLVALRGKMMQGLAPGSMLAVPLSEEEVAPLLSAGLSVAVINAPAMTVISGEEKKISDLKDKLLAERGLDCQVLHTSHAFHSHLMDPIVEEFAHAVSSYALGAPQIPFVSNVSGTWITDAEATSPQYWASHLRRPVRFYSCVDSLIAAGKQLFVEVGPGQVLTHLAKLHPASKACRILPTTRRPVARKDDQAVLFDFIGSLWAAGGYVYWAKFWGEELRQKKPLPTYPFQETKYWIKAAEHKISTIDKSPGELRFATSITENCADISNICGPRNDLELQIANIFSNLLGTQKVDIQNSFFDIGGDSLLAVRLLSDLRRLCDADISLADIYENQSVETLSTLIQKGGGYVRSTILPLNSGIGNHQIYFVVGIHIYQALAQRLNNTASCYGVYLPAEGRLFNNSAKNTQWAVSDLASAYREEIIKHSGGRPVSLVGVSFGGVVAYELARQLTQTGQTVPLLVMLDSLLPTGIRRNHAQWLIGQIQNIFINGPGPFMRKVFSKLIPEIVNKTAKSKGYAAPGNMQRGDIPDQRSIVYANAVDRFEAQSRESLTTYPGRTLLIRAQDVVKGPGDKIDIHYGWKKHLTGEFTIDSAPGDHLGILTSPNVDKTAAGIEHILSKFDLN